MDGYGQKGVGFSGRTIFVNGIEALRHAKPSRCPHDLDHRTAHDHIRCNMTKDEELERLYKAYDEQHEMFKQLYYKQAEAHRYQLDVIWSVLNFHWQVIKVRMR